MASKEAVITADWLLARVVQRDWCLVWTGSCDNGGRDPRATLGGQSVNVRRAIWSAMHGGRKLPADCMVGVSCKTPGCVDPAHIVARSRSKALRGIPKTLAHKAAIATTKRKNSKLPQDKVADVLLSTLTGAKEAEQHGLCKAMVNRIRAGQARRDYSSPFAGLGAP